MKNIFSKIVAGLLLVGSTFACSESFLDLQDPNRESMDTFWKTEEQFRQGLSASYSGWRRPHLFSRWFHAWMILRSDEGYSESPAPEWKAYGNFQLTTYNTDGIEGITNPWIGIYSQLFYVNQVIDNMNSHGYDVFTDKTEADRLLGQAYFIRGVDYWFLGGTYGKGPLQLSSVGEGPVVEQEAIYKQALKDFQDCENLLPLKWTGSDLGRVTKGASLGMQARVNMQLAGYYKRPSINNTEEADKYWRAAKKNIEDIFALNLYDLVPNWVDNFTESNENNIESIFEIQFRDGLYNGKETGMHRPKFFGLYLASGEGAWNDGSACDWLLDEFDKEVDKAGKPDIRKYYTLFYDNPEDDMKYYGKTYQEWKAVSADALPHKCYWRKYTSVDSDNKSEDYSSGVNFRVLRLADVYLMYAEVLNELNGDRGMAVEYINKVRRRVNMSDLNAASFQTYDALKEQLRHERLVELCGECVRWYDLDRWGDIHTQEGVNKIAERDEDFKTYRVGISHLICIPNHEVSLYPGLTQNPGY